MFAPAPIDNDFVPYTKRPVLKRNAGLFVDGTAGRGRGTPRVVPQQQIPCVQHCMNRTTDGLRCGANCGGTCQGPTCILPL
jgi:hypothetical protein